MAFGIKRKEVIAWKESVMDGEIAFLTHYWYDTRFPHYHTVTKVGCNNVDKLIRWGKQHGLEPEWIDHKENFPHFDILGERQITILQKEDRQDHIERFHITKPKYL